MRFSDILIWSLTATVTAGLLFAVKWLFREHLTAKWHYLVWVILLARLVIPPTGGLLPKNDYSLGNAVDVSAIAGAAARQAETLYTGETPPTPVVMQSEGRAVRLHPTRAVLPGWADTLNRTLFWLWAAGAAGLLLYYFAAGLRLRARTRRYPQADEGLQARAAQMYRVAARLESDEGDHAVRVRLAPAGATPYVCGVFCPTLIVPAPMAATVDDQVLLHEMVHMVRHDIVKNYVYMVFRCLHWFNPLLWRTFNRISDDCETACDECVLDRLEPEEHIGYGRRLLEMVQPGFRYRMGTSCIASGERNIRRRIVRVTRHKEVSRRARGMGFVLFCLLAWMCLTPPQAQAVRWRDPGVPGADTAKWLQKAGRYRVGDIHEALYLYGKSYALDNGYYRYLVADDQTRGELVAQFAQNEAPLVWHFDDWAIQEICRVKLGEQRDNPRYADIPLSPSFGLYNILETEDGGSAVLAWPVEKSRIEEGDADTTVYTYYYETLYVEREAGRWVVRSETTGKKTTHYEITGLNIQPLITYHAEDPYFEYELRLSYGQSYTFYQYNRADGTWAEQQQSMLAAFGWGGGNGLPPNADGWSAELYFRPKEPARDPIGLGYYISTEPPEDDSSLPRNGAGYTGGGGGGSNRFNISSMLGGPEDYQAVSEDGWYRTDGDVVSWAFSLWKRAEPPEKLYLRTRFAGRDEDAVLTISKIGETEVARDGG